MLKCLCCLGSLTFIISLSKPPLQLENVLSQPHLTSSLEQAVSYFPPGAWPETSESPDICHFHLHSIKLTKKKLFHKDICEVLNMFNQNYQVSYIIPQPPS